MTEISPIGLDLAKRVFQVHGLDETGAVTLRRPLRRAEIVKFFAKLAPCVVGMEACASSHYWARTLAKLGHEIRLIPPSQVKPYVKRGRKNDAADAAAIAEAVTRPHMPFVPVKSEDTQAVLMLHRTRRLLVGQRTMLANALRSHFAEFGIVEPEGQAGLTRLVVLALDAPDTTLPQAAREALAMVAPPTSRCCGLRRLPVVMEIGAVLFGNGLGQGRAKRRRGGTISGSRFDGADKRRQFGTALARFPAAPESPKVFKIFVPGPKPNVVWTKTFRRATQFNSSSNSE